MSMSTKKDYSFDYYQISERSETNNSNVQPILGKDYIWCFVQILSLLQANNVLLFMLNLYSINVQLMAINGELYLPNI